MTMKDDNARQAGLARLAHTAHRRGMEVDALNCFLLEANARRCVPPLAAGEVLPIAARAVEGPR